MEIYGYAIIPIVIGLVEVLKRAGLPKNLAPLASVILGIVISIFYLTPDNILQAVFLGTVIGLSAVGLYSGARTTFRKK